MRLRRELIVLSQGKYQKEVKAIYNEGQNWHKTNQCSSVRN